MKKIGHSVHLFISNDRFYFKISSSRCSTALDLFWPSVLFQVVLYDVASHGEWKLRLDDYETALQEWIMATNESSIAWWKKIRVAGVSLCQKAECSIIWRCWIQEWWFVTWKYDAWNVLKHCIGFWDCLSMLVLLGFFTAEWTFLRISSFEQFVHHLSMGKIGPISQSHWAIWQPNMTKRCRFTNSKL